MLFIHVLGLNCECSNYYTRPDSERNILGSWTTPFISSTCTGVTILAFLSRNRYSLNESSNYAVSGKYSALHNTQHFISRRISWLLQRHAIQNWEEKLSELTSVKSFPQFPYKFTKLCNIMPCITFDAFQLSFINMTTTDFSFIFYFIEGKNKFMISPSSVCLFSSLTSSNNEAVFMMSDVKFMTLQAAKSLNF
jgi:hypothetical protein